MQEYTKHVPVGDIRRMEIRVPRGDIQIERTSGDTIDVASDDPITVEQTGVSLIVRSGAPLPPPPPSPVRPPRFGGSEPVDLGASISHMVASAVESIFKAEIHVSGFGSADIRIGIPALLERPELAVSTGSGEISMKGVTADSSLQSSSGEIAVEDCGGTLKVTTGMGDLSVERFAGFVNAHTGSGDAKIGMCEEGGTIHTGSGDIDAHRIDGAWHIVSGAGDVDVRVSHEASLEISTGAGDVDVDHGSVHRLAVHSGSGDVECSSLLVGPQHQLSTGHGDIHVAIANPPGARLQVLTRNGDVKSEYPLVMVGKQGRHAGGGGRYVGNIGDSSVDVQLRTASGDIAITRRAPERDGSPRRERPEAPARSNSESYAYAAAESSWASADAEAHGNLPSEPEWRETPIEMPDDGVARSEEAPAPAATSGGNPRLAVLENLQAGKISVNEAAALLAALAQKDSGR